MHLSSVLLVAIISARVNAVPLNINLGAYSPALVVGDGEISFKGKEDVTELMDALEGAAVSGAAKNGAGPAAPGAGEDPTTETQVVGDNPQADIPLQGMGKGVVSGDSSARIITPLHGMGKKIAPRSARFAKRDNDKRNINGFAAALTFASESMGKNPGIELSTGPDGSGTGIKVSPSGAVGGGGGGAAPAPPKAGGGGGAGGANKRNIVFEKRDDDSSKTKTTVTTMYVRGGPTSDSEESDVGVAIQKRDSPSVDGVNLKVADGQLAELTFVETRSDNDNDERDD